MKFVADERLSAGWGQRSDGRHWAGARRQSMGGVARPTLIRHIWKRLSRAQSAANRRSWRNARLASGIPETQPSVYYRGIEVVRYRTASSSPTAPWRTSPCSSDRGGSRFRLLHFTRVILFGQGRRSYQRPYYQHCFVVCRRARPDAARVRRSPHPSSVVRESIGLLDCLWRQ